jgi:hypothetical protein
LHLDDGRRDIAHLEEDDAIDADRNVILGDDLLGGDYPWSDTDVHETSLVHDGDDEEETGPLIWWNLPKRKTTAFSHWAASLMPDERMISPKNQRKPTNKPRPWLACPP